MPNAQPPTDKSPTDIRTVCLMVLAGAAVTYLIYWLRPVLVPLVVAVFVVSGLGPILTTLESRLGVTRIIAAMLTFLAGVVLLVVFGCSLWISVIDLASNADAYRGRVRELVGKVENALPIELSADEDDVSSSFLAGENEKVAEFVDSIMRTGIAQVSQTLISLVTTSVVVLIYVFFLLLGTPSAKNPSATWRGVEHQIRSFLAMKTVISIFTGIAFGLALRLFGVPMALTFGVLAFLLNFIPNIGPLVASLLPIPLIILDPEGSVGWMVAVITVSCGIQMISGNIVEPKLMGDTSDLHPVTILVGLMFWGMMWGIVGMFLATPIMAGMKILFERIDATRPIANLMAGRLPEDTEAPPAVSVGGTP